MVAYIFPIFIFGYVWITIWFCGYMPSATGRMKQLVRELLCSSKTRAFIITQKTSSPYNFLVPQTLAMFSGLVLLPYSYHFL